VAWESGIILKEQIELSLGIKNKLRSNHETKPETRFSSD